MQLTGTALVTGEDLAAQGVAPEHIDICLRTLTECGMRDGARSFSPIDAGMTNTSYRFEFDGTRYLLRVAGAGTGAFIDRAQEFEVYRLLEGSGITDRAVFLDAATGVKVTEFIEDARTCEADDREDVRRCMELLRRFHDYSRAEGLGSALIGDFDLLAKLAEYEAALGDVSELSARFADYRQVRAKAQRVWELIGREETKRCLCHIDPVAHNFLIRGDDVRLIDWEYASMSDPDLDIAMFCVYSGFGREEVDAALRAYVGAEPSASIRRKVYAYCGLAGLVWTVWCELRRKAGAAYDEYQEIQYGYPRRFFDLLLDGEI